MLFLCLCQQYSEKEDKYEEEIKVLTDKLKEVSGSTSSDDITAYTVDVIFVIVVKNTG